MREELDIVIARVKQMEQYMDEVSEVLKNCPESIKEDEEIRLKIAELENYQESGQWLLDYESDEREELPSDLKRGVLSEDMLYNLLCDVRMWMRNNKTHINLVFTKKEYHNR